MTVDDVWVVMTCRDGAAQYWAWCRPNRHSPGFDEIFYTTVDGIKAFSPPDDDLPQLIGHVFTVVFQPEGVASTGARFPEQPAADAGWRPTPLVVEAVQSDDGSAV
jgi:hypothetical protein